MKFLLSVSAVLILANCCYANNKPNQMTKPVKLMKKGEYKKAIPLLEKLAKTFAYKTQADINLLQCYFSTGQYKKIAAYAKQFNQKYLLHREAQLTVAHALFRTGDYKNALAWADEYHIITPTFYPGTSAWILYSQGKIKAARKRIIRAIAPGNSTGFAHITLADFFLLENENKKAASAIINRQAITKYTFANRLLISIIIDQDKKLALSEQAKAYCNKDFSQDDWLHKNQLLVKILTGKTTVEKIEKQKKLFTFPHERDEFLSRAYLYQAEYFISKSNPKLAQKYFKKCLDKDQQLTFEYLWAKKQFIPVENKSSKK